MPVTKFIDGEGNVEFDNEDDYREFLRTTGRPDMQIKTVSPAGPTLENTTDKYSDELRGKADVQQILNKLFAAQIAQQRLGKIKDAKSETSTGPLYSRMYDSALPKYDPQTNVEMAPDFLDSLMTKIAPTKTQNMRKLYQAMRGLSDYLSTTSGKSITSGETGLVLPQFPDIYATDSTFNSVFNDAAKNMQDYQGQNLQMLENLGYPKSAIQGLLKGLDPNKSDMGVPSIDVQRLSDVLRQRGVQ